MQFPAYYGKVVYTDVMPSGVSLVRDGEGTIRCFLILSPKILADSLSIPHHTPVCYICTCRFLCDVVPIIRGHQEVPDGVTSFEIDLDPHFATNIFEAFA